MDLLPFDPVYAGTVASWPLSRDEVVMWCGEHTFPLSAHRVARWQGNDGSWAYLLPGNDGAPIGYGELLIDADEDEVELARIIIAPAARGRGLGRVLVRGLLAEAAKTGRADVFLRVYPENAMALRCYRGAGLVPVDPSLAKEWNVPQPVDYVWLQPPD